MMHIRKHKVTPARTSRNWTVHHHMVPDAETLCGAPVTDRDVRLSEVIRNGKLTKLARVEWQKWDGCPKCLALIGK